MKKQRLLDQVNIGQHIGALKDLFVRTLMYGAAFTGVGVAVDLYQDWIYIHWPWLPLWGFFLIGGCILTLIMFLEYKYIRPSSTEWDNRQVSNHPNPWLDIIKNMQSDIMKIKEGVIINEAKKISNNTRLNKTRNRKARG